MTRLTRRLSTPAIVILGMALQPWTATLAIAGGRMESELTCEPADQPLTYDCTIELRDRDTGQPIEGADLQMQTSMPAMPMAHHMPAVEGVPGDEPGVYHATIHFEMAGEWAIDVLTSAPIRDRTRHTIMVRTEGTVPGHQEPKRHK